MGVFVGAYSPEQRLQVHNELLKLYELGKLTPAVEKLVAFSQVPQSIAELEQRRVSGKLVIGILSGGNS